MEKAKTTTEPGWLRSCTARCQTRPTIREIKINGKVIITTLLNPKEVTRKELGELYTKRWFIEVDFRSIKTVLRMDILRCKTPDMVRKEI